MSRKFAIIENNIVVSVEQLDEIEVEARSKEVQALIDIEDMIPQPEVSWILSGNTLQSANSNMSLEEADAYQQKAQRLFGLKILPLAVDKIGARNLKLARETTPADVAALAGQMASIKLLLEGGALKTARTICTAIKPSFPLHADVLQEVVDEINAFLTANGWN